MREEDETTRHELLQTARMSTVMFLPGAAFVVFAGLFLTACRVTAGLVIAKLLI